MRTSFLLLAGVLSAAALSACAPTTDADRALIGAGVGAVAADLDGKNVATGALAGAAAGAVCDDVGVCQRRGPYYRGYDGRLR